MKRFLRPPVSPCFSRGAVCALLAGLVVPFGVLAVGPAWWGQRGVIATDANGSTAPSDDYSAANVGQLKQIAFQAFQELQARIPGGVGDMQAPGGTGYRLTQLVDGWSVAQQNPTAKRTTTRRLISAS